jgi:hypothetical protein
MATWGQVCVCIIGTPIRQVKVGCPDKSLIFGEFTRPQPQSLDFARNAPSKSKVERAGAG